MFCTNLWQGWCFIFLFMLYVCWLFLQCSAVCTFEELPGILTIIFSQFRQIENWNVSDKHWLIFFFLFACLIDFNNADEHLKWHERIWLNYPIYYFSFYQIFISVLMILYYCLMVLLLLDKNKLYLILELNH